MPIAKHFPLPTFLRSGDSAFFYDAITELYEMVGAMQQGASGMVLTGFSPKDVPNGLQHTVTGTGLTDPWGAGAEYLLAFSLTGGDGEPTGWRGFAGEWSDTELTTAILGKTQVDSAGSVGSDYDCFLIQGDDQGDPVQPFVVLSNVLTAAVTLAVDPE